MDLLSSFQSDVIIEIGYIDLFFNLIITSVLGWLLEYFFINYSQTINNKKIFSKFYFNCDNNCFHNLNGKIIISFVFRFSWCIIYN